MIQKFEEIFTEYLNQLYNFAMKLTSNSVEAEDLVGDTFLRAFRFFSKFNEGTNIKAWLFKIMYNVFINSYRKKKKEPEILELKDEILNLPDVSRDFLSYFLNTEIQQALDSLPEEFMEVIILSDLENFNYKEISEILNCPVGTVRSRLFRARKLLFKKLYHYGRSHGYLK